MVPKLGIGKGKKPAPQKNTAPRLEKNQKWRKILRNNWELYLLVLPAVAYFVIFEIVPLNGLQIAFRDFRITREMSEAEWVGFKHFERFVTGHYFTEVISNTIRLSLYSLILSVPLPVGLALMLNYCRNKRFVKIVQTVSYAPHFISTVVVISMLNLFLNPDNGVITNVIEQLGGKATNLMASPDAFPHLYVWSGIWQGLGWSAIIYIGALTGVSPELHEAAVLDGATILQRIRYVDIPGIKNTIIMLLIMKTGQVLGVGFEKVYLMQNALNSSTAEVISTYTYKMGMTDGQYSFATAIGFFNSVISFFLVMLVNSIAKKYSDNSLY